MSELEVWELRNFQTSGGRVPFREWRESLAIVEPGPLSGRGWSD